MYLGIALRNLKQGGRRTWLLGIALALVAGLLVQLLSLSNGVHDSMVQAATTLSAGHVNVSGFFKASPTSASAPIVTRMSEVRAFVEKEAQGVDFIIDRHRGWAKGVSDTGSMWVGLFGVDITKEKQLLANLRSAPEADYRENGGTERPGDLRRLTEPNSIALFAGQAKRLQVGIGDRITLRTETLRGTSNTADLTVVAIAEDLGILSSWNVLVPKQTILDLYGLEADSTGAIMLYLDEIGDAPEVMADLSGKLEKAGYKVLEHDPRPFFMKFETISGQDWSGQKLDLTTWDDEVSFMQWILTAIDSVSLLLIMVLAGIIALGIMNAMWIAVRERTREIGTLRAIGMSQRGVLTMFILEAAALGAIGATTGALLSATFSVIADSIGISIPVTAVQSILMSETLHFVVKGTDLLYTIVGFTVFCAVSAIWPAVRAARMRPITAIHTTE